MLTWSRALGEFGATITFAGNLPGVTQTAPLAIYISQSSGRMDEAIALSLVIAVVSLVVMIVARAGPLLAVSEGPLLEADVKVSLEPVLP